MRRVVSYGLARLNCETICIIIVSNRHLSTKVGNFHYLNFWKEFLRIGKRESFLAYRKEVLHAIRSTHLILRDVILLISGEEYIS
jgi:hypothetical protein